MDIYVGELITLQNRSLETISTWVYDGREALCICNGANSSTFVWQSVPPRRWPEWADVTNADMAYWFGRGMSVGFVAWFAVYLVKWVSGSIRNLGKPPHD
jgi:hypothetical protein